MMAAEELTSQELHAHYELAAVFRTLGFMETEAHLLASALVKPEDAQRLLGRGCSHQWAVKILI